VTWPGLPVLMMVAGRPVILLGDGEAAEAKRRVLERAGATVVADHPAATLAVVAVEDDADAVAAVARLRARGLLVNAVDRPPLCDWTLPAVVDRSPVLVAIATGGVSAGLAAALRQRLDRLLPANLGRLADAMFAARARLRTALPDGAERRRAIGAAFEGELNPMDSEAAGRADAWLAMIERTAPETVRPDLVEGPLDGVDRPSTGSGRTEEVSLHSPDPDDITLRQARWLASADRVFHAPDVPPAILHRARADAPRLACDAPPRDTPAGFNVWIGWA
jgi:uroporphyrin-III C-methyltransferase/precorrin-2 dehydrogenase/sirohydrochlorin ferrochelatase